MIKTSDRPCTRREAIQWSMALFAANLVVSASTDAHNSTYPAPKRESRGAEGSYFSADELALLGEVAETIVPTSDTPGAKDANVHNFIDHLMAQWALPETQKQIRTVLSGIEADANHRFSKRFVTLTAEQKLEIIVAIDSAAFPPMGASGQESENHPFARFKGLVLLGYYHSEIGATQELQFQLVPGRYDACVALADIGRARVENDLWESLIYGRMITL
jgi:hypothetical protein